MSVSLLDQELFPFEADWHMVPAERCALLYILQTFQPEISIEIGTFLGGSLRPISRHSQKVYTFDIDPNQHRIKPHFSNVEFITGDSAQTLPPIVNQINSAPSELGFILVDGSHEANGVVADINCCLKYKPKKKPTIILMHDSANPEVRAGILRADWAQNPHVHLLDLDFVPGMLFDRFDISGQIWGGLALAILMPQPRATELHISRIFQHSLDALMKYSVY